MSNKIILFGPQGSGKGTQAQLISNNFNIPHISTGDIFRQNIKEKTDLGIKIEELIKAGHLVSDEITNAIVKNRLQEKDCERGFILDGFPRNIEQANFLDNFIKIDLAIEIWISDEEAVKRIGMRRTCANCGSVFHLIHLIPKIENICDKCGGQLIIREDDQEAAIRKRLDTYHNQTENLIEHYTKKGVYKKIDGTRTIDKVNDEVSRILTKG